MDYSLETYIRKTDLSSLKSTQKFKSDLTAVDSDSGMEPSLFYEDCTGMSDTEASSHELIRDLRVVKRQDAHINEPNQQRGRDHFGARINHQSLQAVGNSMKRTVADARERIIERQRLRKKKYGTDPYMQPSFNPSREIMQNGTDNNSTRSLRGSIIPPSSFQQEAKFSVLEKPVSLPLTPLSQTANFTDLLNRIGQTSGSKERDAFANIFCNLMRTQNPVQWPNTVGRDQLDQMSSNEIMQPAAASLLSHFTALGQSFGPKYDIKVQKQIHSLQGKKLIYGTSGVVSTDGPGVGNEAIRPATTNLSMNVRFS